MSAYGQEMEREFSTQSVSTRGGSEMGSRYTTEAGIYMSSFAATVFITGLVTVGISLLSLLVALIVMLQSCEKGNSEVIEYKYYSTYDYCKNFALHADLNSLDADSFPGVCKDVAIQYIKEGQYRRDLNITVRIAEDFFSSVRPIDDGRDIVLMDADDFFTSETLNITNLSMHLIGNILHDSARDAKYLKHIFVVKLYLKLQFGRWPIILLSRKPENLRDATAEYLKSAGCRGWFSLIMRRENETQMDSEEFLSRQRSILQSEGFRIKTVISSQMDALRGPCLGDRIFKIPNPIFSYSMDHVERPNQED